jgi:hypothetical protein
LVRFEEIGGNYTVESIAANATDSDSDGMPDAWEKAFGITSAAADADSDGVSNAAEFARGGHPGFGDHFEEMYLVGSLNGWASTANPMRWNSATSLWELLVGGASPGAGQEAKFVAGTSWSAPNWGDKNNDSIGDRDTGLGEGIRYTMPALPGYTLFRFDEITNEYSASVIPTTDTDSDGLPDAWAAYYGVSGSGNNPDGDSHTNAQELARGSDPGVPNYLSNFPEMRLVGDFNNWEPANAPSMALVGENLWRLDFAGFNGTATRKFKFVAGGSWFQQSWGDKNMDGAADQLSENDITFVQHLPGTYRFEFNDQTLSYSFALLSNFSSRYPGFSANQTVRGLPAKVEYLFGGTAGSPPPAAHLPTFGPAGSNMRLSFVRRTDDPILNYVVEFRSDLATGAWQPAGNRTSEEGASSGLERVSFDFPVNGTTKGFYRIRAW